ncbi:hypothetical protein FQN60_002119 [Etheostoma spectabile]|uniref:Uncharacterized protein n=1 Tax=Etheostoma spectabile TaxID=54343 RepID=A0A5J5DDC7_9PERO|nr:hypothetical protein FQN60_002119 [Etheostoma spectabile]
MKRKKKRSKLGGTVIELIKLTKVHALVKTDKGFQATSKSKMEDFEFSVEICDRDWECFFAECEECDLLPPSLAVVDDSGMSDIDDTRSIHAKMVKKANLTPGFSEADPPVDGPPDCEGSPVECYLSKHVIGGMESVLSGSEEDIHLQSVNIFFETLNERTEAERLTEPSQVRNGKNREAILELERCSDGQQASSISLPKNIPKLTSLPASYETAVGKETAEPVDTISNINTMEKNVPGSNISPEPAANSYVPAMEVSQNDKLSAAKLVLAVEAGNCGRDNHTLCQREAEPQQQLEIDRQESEETNMFAMTNSGVFQLDESKSGQTNEDTSSDPNYVESSSGSVMEVDSSCSREFDTEGFFYPLIKADDPTKNERVPIFSYSRSANRNLQFPEAYDHFFASSSSDDSSVESDEEDSCSPVRVVTRFSRASSASQSSTDIYENFFTDGDLRLFWKTTLSFRNISLTGSTVQKQTLKNPLSHGPVRQVHPINALGNQDVLFPDPLLYHMEDRSCTQIAQRPFRYEDLETAVSNPRLDASLLPLRQSDMCLVCIAFASWVLKTANPQVGDAWKAVLLANVSALSAIRYLRKYVKTEAAASEKKFTCTNPSGSSDLSPSLYLQGLTLGVGQDQASPAAPSHRGGAELEGVGWAVSVEEGRLELYCRDNKHTQDTIDNDGVKADTCGEAKTQRGESSGAKVTPQATKTESGYEAPNISICDHEPVWAVAAEAEVSQAVTPCQRLVEETERVGEEGGGKFSSSNTATPTLLRRVNMQEAATHLLLRGLYFSMELRLELPSLPPTAYNQPSIATRSWAHLRMFMGATPSQVLALGLNRSTEFRQLVPSLPPATYSMPSNTATPALLRRLSMLAMAIHAGSSIITSSSVQKAMQDRYTQTAPPCAHGNLRLPGVGDGVVGFYSGKV